VNSSPEQRKQQGRGGVCRELMHTEIQADSGGVPRVCTVPHMRRRQSLMILQVASATGLPAPAPSSEASAAHVAATPPESCRGIRGGGGRARVGGFWHILTLASDWAEQAQHALDLFPDLPATRLSSTVIVMVSGPFADVVVAWIHDRQRLACPGGSRAGSGGGGAECGGAWALVQVVQSRALQDMRGMTRLAYENSFYSEVQATCARSSLDYVWVTSSGLDSRPGAAGSWHRSVEGAPSYDLRAAWSVLAHPAACITALEGGSDSSRADLCASCLLVHPVVHVACQTFWARSSYVVSLLPPSRMEEKELYTIHHDLMSSDWIVNAWNARVAHDVSIHYDWLRKGVPQEAKGRQDRKEAADWRDDADAPGGEHGHQAAGSCPHEADGGEVGEDEGDRFSDRPALDVIQILRPGYLEHTCQLQVSLLAEIDYSALREAAADGGFAVTQGAGGHVHEGETGRAEAREAGAAGTPGANWFARVLAYSKDVSAAFTELHVRLPPSPAATTLGAHREERRRQGRRAQIEVELDLSVLSPHIPSTHGPFAEIAVALLVYQQAQTQGEGEDEIGAPAPEAVDHDELAEDTASRPSQGTKNVLEASLWAHTATQPLPEPVHPPVATAHTRLILRRECGSAPRPTGEANRRPSEAHEAHGQVFQAPTPELVAAFARASAGRCGHTRFGGGMHRFCGFEHVIYRREQAHAHIEYSTVGAKNACEEIREHSAGTARGMHGMHGGTHPQGLSDPPAGDRSGDRSSANSSALKAECPPERINLVHPLHCCPAYHAALRVRHLQQPLRPETCQAFVEQVCSWPDGMRERSIGMYFPQTDLSALPASRSPSLLPSIPPFRMLVSRS
jgi:hypothetical protein